jgi:large subunit ribosomal protein L5
MNKKSRLKEKYEKEIIKKLASEFDISNKMAVPRVNKVVVNMGVGNAAGDKGLMEQARGDLTAITGQLPSTRAARISVASFSVREGMPVGLKVTLRKDRMYDFLDKLFSVVLPRLRDFRGVPIKSFDKNGNYTLGIEESTVFPEIDLAKSKPRGLEVTIVTSTDDVKKARALLTHLGMPFVKEENMDNGEVILAGK